MSLDSLLSLITLILKTSNLMYEMTALLQPKILFPDSTKTMIWIWKLGDQILALNERPYDIAASRSRDDGNNVI